MAAWGASSGDLIVDRRFAFAEGLAAEGDLAAAIELLSDALQRVPDWAAGWFRLGEWHEAQGALAAACVAWEKALALDSADRLGAGIKRDLARRVPMIETLPAAFVETLFDQYAAKFDTALVEKLDYRAPELLRAALANRRFGRVMDLGCGTGLAGEAFRDAADWLAGCDLSAAMLGQAQSKGVYDQLDKVDLADLELGAAYDLILAADVFVYLGALERIVAWCAGSLNPGGVLAFTVEAGDAPLTLRESRRFAHSRRYVEDVLTAAGFSAIRITDAVLRRDRGAEIAGFVVVAQGLLRHAHRQSDGEDAVLA